MESQSTTQNATSLLENKMDYILGIFQREELPKGHLLYKKGEVCRRIYFIQKGIARVYYTSRKGKDITAWFSAENTFITALDSFAGNVPTNDYCELLEPSVVYWIDYPQLEIMLMGNSDNARLAFHVVIEILKKLTEFITSIKFQSAKDRFDSLINDYPAIFLRVPLGHIASYLGITQETLSRMRAKK